SSAALAVRRQFLLWLLVLVPPWLRRGYVLQSICASPDTSEQTRLTETAKRTPLVAGFVQVSASSAGVFVKDFPTHQNYLKTNSPQNDGPGFEIDICSNPPAPRAHHIRTARHHPELPRVTVPRGGEPH